MSTAVKFTVSETFFFHVFGVWLVKGFDARNFFFVGVASSPGRLVVLCPVCRSQDSLVMILDLPSSDGIVAGQICP